MAFDLRIIEPLHLFLGLVGFVGTFFMVRLASKRSHQSIVRVGGIIILIATILAVFVIPDIELVIGLLLASGLMWFVGLRDERKSIPPLVQLGLQVGIVLVLLISGWHIPFVSNPFGNGLLYLSRDIATSLLLWSPLWTLMWVLLMVNTMNWIDGIDGLAASIGIAACMVLIGISLLPATQDTVTLGLAVIGVGVISAFLVWNILPARAYLGTSGSWFLGLYIALTALYGGGKIATTLLVLAVPILDALFVIISRISKGQAPWKKDTHSHIHHRLQAMGLLPWQITTLLAGISFLLGIGAVMLQTHLKILILVVIVIGLGLVIVLQSSFVRKNQP